MTSLYYTVYKLNECCPLKMAFSFSPPKKEEIPGPFLPYPAEPALNCAGSFGQRAEEIGCGLTMSMYASVLFFFFFGQWHAQCGEGWGGE